MHFIQYIWKHRVAEWQFYYIDYKILNKMLKAMRLLAVEMHGSFEDAPEGMQQLMCQLDRLFLRAFQDQIKLFADFCHYKFHIRLKRRLIIIMYNVKCWHEESLSASELKRVQRHIKIILQKYYSELHLFRSYIKLNDKIVTKLIYKYHRSLALIGGSNVEEMVTLRESFFSQSREYIKKRLRVLVQLCETMILRLFYIDNNKHGQRELSLLSGFHRYSKKQLCLLGVNIGVFLMSAVVTVVTMAETDFFSPSQSKFIIYQFPVFRGALVLFIYVLFIGWNFYIWDDTNINFKKLMNIQLLHIDAYSIMKQAFFFLDIWFLVFLYCGISNSLRYNFNKNVFNPNVAAYLPPIPWIVFFLFMIFPSRHYLHGKARIFVLKLIGKIIIGPFVKFSALTLFALDQLTSFFIILRDLAYTFCYSINMLSTGDPINTCEEYPFKATYLVVTALPFGFKLLFILNRIIRLLLQKDKPTNTKKLIIRNVLDFGRISLAFATVFISFFYTDNHSLFVAWIVMAIALSTVVMYIWDVTVEWGFFVHKRVLRRQRAYHQNWLYYVALVANLGLRYNWTVTTSPALFVDVATRNIVVMISAILESFRRILWNLFTVEYRQIKFIGELKSMNEDTMPFLINLDMSDTQVFELVNQQFNFYTSEYFFTMQFKNDKVKWDQPGGEIEQLSRRFPESANDRNAMPAIDADGKQIVINEEEEKKILRLYNQSLNDCLEFLRTNCSAFSKKKKEVKQFRELKRKLSFEEVPENKEADEPIKNDLQRYQSVDRANFKIDQSHHE